MEINLTNLYRVSRNTILLNISILTYKLKSVARCFKSAAAKHRNLFQIMISLYPITAT